MADTGVAVLFRRTFLRSYIFGLSGSCCFILLLFVEFLLRLLLVLLPYFLLMAFQIRREVVERLHIEPRSPPHPFTDSNVARFRIGLTQHCLSSAVPCIIGRILRGSHPVKVWQLVDRNIPRGRETLIILRSTEMLDVVRQYPSSVRTNPPDPSRR